MPKSAFGWPSRTITYMLDFKQVENAGEAEQKSVSMENQHNATISAQMVKILAEVNNLTPSLCLIIKRTSSAQSNKSSTSLILMATLCMVTEVF
jgi:hypothetical protein